jgi:uncharacterized protein
MSLVDQINIDLKDAMKAQNSELTGILRMLKSAIKNTEISIGHELTDSEAMSVLEKQAKQRRDSMEQFVAGSRQDLADVEAAELLLIEKYLPTKMTSAEVTEIVKATIVELGATSAADMGKVIQSVMTKTAGAADGKTVSTIVRENL